MTAPSSTPAVQPEPHGTSVRLVIVRHGETEWNAGGRIQGQTDVHLSAHGEAQARRLSSRLAEEPIAVAYTSDLQRAWRTAELAVEGRSVSIVRDPVWRELHFGEWEGLNYAEAASRDPELASKRLRHPAYVAPPNGEHLGDLITRIRPALDSIRGAHAGETVLIATHGGVVRVLGCYFLGLDLELAWRLTAGNTGVSVVMWWDDGPIMETWNDTSHLRVIAHAPSLGPSPTPNYPAVIRTTPEEEVP